MKLLCSLVALTAFAPADISGTPVRIPVPEPHSSLVFSEVFQPSAEHDYKVSWATTDSHLYVTVTAATTGYLGWGVAEGGGMKGSDLAVLWVDDDGEPHAADYYSHDTAYPILDEEESATLCGTGTEPADGHQSYVAFSGFQTDTHTTVTFGRALDTHDSMDWPIVDDGDATRLLFSYSPTDSDTLTYHGVNRGAYRMNLFQSKAEFDPLAALRADPNVKEFLFLNNNQKIKKQVTTYSDVYYDITDNFDDNIQIVGFEHVLDEGHASLVHHFVLSAHKVPDDAGTTIWPWAAGVQPFAFPQNTGFLMGKTATFKGLNMNTHFDNPTNIAGLEDNSGIRLFYVEKEHFREHEVGIIQVGDPRVLLSTLEPELPIGASRLSISCPGSCTDNYLTKPITLISAQLHMHAVGDAIRVEHTRGDQILHTFKTEYYDYAFQDIVPTSEAAGVVVQPGDGFNIECAYKTDEQVNFGPTSSDEMCISFIMYYPKLSDIDECGINPGAFTASERLGKAYKPKPKSLELTFDDNDDFRRLVEERHQSRELATCVDQDALLDTLTGGFMMECESNKYFCIDDSILVNFGFPADSFGDTLCCATCEEARAEGSDKCIYEDGLISLFTDNAVPDCASFSFFCQDDGGLIESGSPPGFFASVCCRTCDGVPYKGDNGTMACLGDYELEGMEEEDVEDSIVFRTFGGSTGQCVELDNDLLLSGGSSSLATNPALAVAVATVALVAFGACV